MDNSRDAIQHLNVQDVPALIFFENGRKSMYHGSHETSEIIQYIDKQISKDFKLLTTEAHLKGFIDKLSTSHSNVAIVLCFLTEKGSMQADEYEDYQEAAASLKSKVRN